MEEHANGHDEKRGNQISNILSYGNELERRIKAATEIIPQNSCVHNQQQKTALYV